VADFRDPWVGNPMLRPPTPAHRAFHARLESRVMTTADAIIANTGMNREALEYRYPLLRQKIHVIPNGFDEEEFAGLVPTTSRNERMTICHAGSLFPHYDPTPYFSVLAALIAAVPESRQRIRVRLFGSQSEQQAIQRYALDEIVEEHPWCPRPVLLRELGAGDVLLLCMSGSKATDFWVPAKTYTYLRPGKPVLALVPRGEAREILERAGFGRTCDANDADQIAGALHRLFEDWKAGRLQVSPVEEVTQQYEAGTLTAHLARILDAMVHEHEVRTRIASPRSGEAVIG